MESFERRVRIRLSQLKRSRLVRKKIDKELHNVKTPEEAKEYIKQAGERSVEEIKMENLKK